MSPCWFNRIDDEFCDVLACKFAKMIQIGVHQVCRSLMFEISIVRRRKFGQEVLPAYQKAKDYTRLVVASSLPYEIQDPFLHDAGTGLCHQTWLFS